ncbi:hypothetical protein GWI33_013923 [Rhynchophorus ferrugineus]|uniref:Histone-lysine N-methyltransferase SETMAR n=1 Tax=Rhynchophorus ferrugineus TaxID=354439 RepID=A0A834M663_RHYFE|nr:hypothetical protein GWI33_013923 [Rhynchophorus ferrugineus]
MSAEDGERSGRPKEVVTDENIKNIHKMILNDRRNQEKRPYLKKKKVLLHQNNAPCHKSVKTMVKIHELGFKLVPHPPYSPDLASSNYFLFSDLKRMLAGKKFSSNEEVIAESEAYFEAKDNWYYKNDIEKLEGRYNRCITLEGNYVEQKKLILPKK